MSLNAAHTRRVALSVTTVGILAATLNSSILLISLPAIFDGLGLNPLAPANISYLLWMLMGYLLVTAVLVVTFGRLGDQYGRARLFNLGFLIFPVASVLCALVPNSGSAGALPSRARPGSRRDSRAARSSPQRRELNRRLVEPPGAGQAGPMLSSVAVLSDIHGVLPVLEAVLAEPDVQAAELIVVTGDHAAGPQPTDVLDRLAALGERALLVRGNADRELLALARGEQIEIPDAVTPWAASQLGPAQLDLLAALPHPAVLELAGFGPVVFCHGTPRRDDEVVLVDTRLERWAEVFEKLPADQRTVVCGHTHMPFVRLVDRRLVINPGSIGMPYGRSGGSWALLRGGQVSLRHTTIDVEAAIAAVLAGSTYPDRQDWAEYYLRASASDAEALTVFAPRDGRQAS